MYWYIAKRFTENVILCVFKEKIMYYHTVEEGEKKILNIT
jgi:hypothetical protein